MRDGHVGVPEPLSQHLCRVQYATNCVADDEDAAAVLERVLQPVGEEIQIVVDALDLDVHPAT